MSNRFYKYKRVQCTESIQYTYDNIADKNDSKAKQHQQAKTEDEEEKEEEEELGKKDYHYI